MFNKPKRNSFPSIPTLLKNLMVFSFSFGCSNYASIVERWIFQVACMIEIVTNWDSVRYFSVVFFWKPYEFFGRTAPLVSEQKNRF